jgi:drug/metabolite transporter (DMT)-like permease
MSKHAPHTVATSAASAATQGLWLGFVGVAIFALTLPMTRIAVGTPELPQMSALFVASARAVLAGLLSLAWLKLVAAPWPQPRQWVWLAVTSAGVVWGFPLLTSLAMRHVQAVHAGVIVGVLPLATAVAGALLNRQRPAPAFWAVAVLGAALVMGFVLLRADAGTRHSWALHPADGVLLLAVACAAVGYASGARLAQAMPAEHVICWALVMSLPLMAPLAAWSWPTATVKPAAWAALGYVSVFSMWIGFFAWYRGLALGGTVRVSQVQLLQPVLTALAAVPLLGERIDAVSISFALAIMATVLVSRRLPVHTQQAAITPNKSA